jgi:protein TonB
MRLFAFAMAAALVPSPSAGQSTPLPEGTFPMDKVPVIVTTPARDRVVTRAPSARLITTPVWTARPTDAQIAALHPPQAAGQQGRTVVECAVSDQGTLQACKVVGETPAGAGFGDAAVALAKHFRIRPAADDGASLVGAHVLVPVRWTPPAS